MKKTFRVNSSLRLYYFKVHVIFRKYFHEYTRRAGRKWTYFLKKGRKIKHVAIFKKKSIWPEWGQLGQAKFSLLILVILF